MNASLITRVSFPPSRNASVNMMPFIMGDHNSLPMELRRYAPLIEACGTEQRGLVGYLTVTESAVQASTSQRRGGIHTESPGIIPNIGPVAWGGGSWGGGSSPEPKPEPKPKPSSRRGGIYMASTVSHSCSVWDVKIEEPGILGDCEHLRGSLGAGVSLEAGEMWWMSDKCPHESLLIPAGTHRQFFRLVTNQVSVWFSRHSTPNPLGVLPDCPILHVNKFSLVA